MRTLPFLRKGLAAALLAALFFHSPRPVAPRGTPSYRKHPRRPAYRSDRSFRKAAARAESLANHRRIAREGVPLKYLHSAARRRLEAE